MTAVRQRNVALILARELAVNLASRPGYPADFARRYSQNIVSKEDNVAAVVSKIEQDYVQQGKVKIEFRMFPFIGQESWDAAQASEAAADQGKFWEYHDALFNSQNRSGNSTSTEIPATYLRVTVNR